MKFLLLNIIRLYWFAVPRSKRRKCIFSKSCSHHVYDETKLNGFKNGVKQLIFRVNNCHSDFDVFTDHITGKKKMLLRTGIIIDESQMADKFK